MQLNKGTTHDIPTTVWEWCRDPLAMGREMANINWSDSVPISDWDGVEWRTCRGPLKSVNLGRNTAGSKALGYGSHCSYGPRRFAQHAPRPHPATRHRAPRGMGIPHPFGHSGRPGLREVLLVQLRRRWQASYAAILRPKAILITRGVVRSASGYKQAPRTHPFGRTSNAGGWHQRRAPAREAS